MEERAMRWPGWAALAPLVAVVLVGASCGTPTPAAPPGQTLAAVERAAPTAAAVLVAAPGAQSTGPSESTVVVVGEGSVPAEPDVAYLTVGVQSRHASAREAQGATNQAVEAVLAALRAAGVADADLRTSGVSLHPWYEGPEGRISAYVASNDVRVTVREVGRAGGILDAAIGAGANQAGNIQFGRRDDRALQDEALVAAVAAARAKAEAVARAAGLRLAGPVALREEWSGPASAETPALAAAPLAKGDVPIEPGRLFVRARVQATYAVAP
jgi:uncharacterized protein YggE